jgi:hypothetical protein
MKKILFVIAIIVTGSFAFCQAPNTWTQKADFGGTVRSGAVGFSISNKGYIGTGLDYNHTYIKDFWEYDLATNTWSQKADFGGTARGDAVGFSISSKGYIGTGSFFDGTTQFFYKDFWEYDPAANSWTQKADFGGVERSVTVGFSIGSKGYLGTGYYNAYPNYLKDFWEYDPIANTWTQKADFGGIARDEAVGFSIDNKGYIGTGENAIYPFFTKDFWEYDPATNIWTQKADFGGVERYDAAGFSIDNKGYIGIGNSYPNDPKDFWEYDPATNTWTQKADFGGGVRWSAVGFSIGGKGHIGTGYGGSSGKDFWEYTSDAVLPLQLISFSAVLQKTNAFLSWKTAHEINTSYFNIQRSFDGAGFTTIAKQNAAGSGITQQYNYTDENIIVLQQTKIFYRLESVDKDGGSTYSNIVALQVNPGSGVFFTISPNPNKGHFTIQMQLPVKAASTTITLYNNLGEIVWQENAGTVSGSATKTIALESKLATGVYVLLVQHGDTRLMQKVVVSK